MNSCIYVGKIRHRRFSPRQHEFVYPLFMMYLDLGELDEVFRGRWLWSADRRAVARFCREDHFGDPNESLSETVRNLVEQETGRRPEGAIRLLTHLRYFGYCFNPISIYYCFDADGHRVQALVAEVTNTPWKERRCYVLGADDDGDRSLLRQRFPKDLHVSPFLPLTMDYEWRSTQPGEHLSVHMNVWAGEEKRVDATLNLKRRPITGRNLARTLARFPWMTLRAIVAIHWQALRLWLKGTPIYDHPGKPSRPASVYSQSPERTDP